jgi:hypothetical protein
LSSQDVDELLTPKEARKILPFSLAWYAKTVGYKLASRSSRSAGASSTGRAIYSRSLSRTSANQLTQHPRQPRNRRWPVLENAASDMARFRDVAAEAADEVERLVRALSELDYDQLVNPLIRDMTDAERVAFEREVRHLESEQPSLPESQSGATQIRPQQRRKAVA